MGLTQSKSKTQITRSVHGKIDCITVVYNGTQHGVYIILEVLIEKLVCFSNHECKTAYRFNYM